MGVHQQVRVRLSVLADAPQQPLHGRGGVASAVGEACSESRPRDLAVAHVRDATPAVTNRLDAGHVVLVADEAVHDVNRDSQSRQQTRTPSMGTGRNA
jgi:hypothetical protein